MGDGEVLLRCDCGWQIQGTILGSGLIAQNNTSVLVQHWKRGHVVEALSPLLPWIEKEAKNIASRERMDDLFTKLRDGIGRL